MKAAQYGLCIVLAAILLYRGIVPAFTKVDTDFPNYYTSAKLLVQGTDLSRLYDDDWFQKQIYDLGMIQLGKFSPYPPVTAFVLTPLASFSPLVALRLWTLFNICLLVITALLLSKINGRGFAAAAVILLLSGHALFNNFRFGQFYLVLTVLVLAGYRAWTGGRQTLAGFFFGLGAAIKYFPILFFILFLKRREWRAVISGVMTVLFIWAGGLFIFGRQVYKEFFLVVLGRHLTGNIQDPYSPVFQSWNSLLRRLFVFEQALNPHPVLNSTFVYSSCLVIVYAIVAGLVILGFRRSTIHFGTRAHEIQFSLLCIAAMLLLPASTTYHFLLLTVPIAILLRSSVLTSSQIVLVSCYALIGFIPYRYTSWFDGKSILTLFAYPRLILMTGLFGSALALEIHEYAPESIHAKHSTRFVNDYSS